MPIQAPQYKIRHLKRHEIEQLLQLCKAEGRQMGTVAEVESWLQIDPFGFYVAVNEEGYIIGSCCGMRLSQAHGYVGMYVVSKDYRGLGIGKQVWNAALKHLGPRNNGLSAVAHLFTLYRDKAGFSCVADWTVDLYKLDNMAVVFPCHEHSLSRGKVNGCKWREFIACHANSSQCLFGSDPFYNQCNLCCLEYQYKNKERKFLKQRKLNRNIEFSDDESYGFSNLFFEENVDGPLQPEDVIRQVESEQSKSSMEQDGLMMIRALEIGFKLRYCSCYQSSAKCNNSKLRTVGVGPGNRYLVEEVVEYDRRMHQYDRSRIVRLTLGEKGCFTRVALLGQAVVGYACAKPNLQNMWIISPLYADNDYVARILMLDLVTDLVLICQHNLIREVLPSIVLKAPSNNHHAAKLLQNLGFVKQDYTLRRCYTKKVFEVPTQNIYALHTSVFCTE